MPWAQRSPCVVASTFGDLGDLLLCAEAFEPVGKELLVSGHWETVGRSGVEVSAPATWVFGIRNGKIAYWQANTSRAAALEAVGLSE